MTTVEMYDSVNPAGVKSGNTSPEAVAGYVDGAWDDYTAMTSMFPAAYHVSVTATGVPGARVVDCEKGDLTPEATAAWCRSEIQAGRRPTVYCSLSAQPAVRQQLQAIQIPTADVDWWDANWGTGDHLDAGDVATQWQSQAGFDESDVQLAWLQGGPGPVQATISQVSAQPASEGNVQIVDVNIGPLDGNGDGWIDVTLPPGKSKENAMAPVFDEADPTTQGYLDKGATIEPDFQVPYPASPNIVRYVLTGFPPNTGLITFRVPVS